MTRTLIQKVLAIPITQPIGTFYLTSMPSDVLSRIASADVRRFQKSGTAVEEYVGIQRSLSLKRESEIAEYVTEVDATFPTSIVIAITDDRCIEYDRTDSTLSFYTAPADQDNVEVGDEDIATILDGQHRLAGLKKGSRVFDLSVTVFPAIDIAEQAYIFATVNLAQTKVNPSLAYDLLAYAKSRSPERTCHDVAVALNDAPTSPFNDSIKRLGSKTPGVIGETLSQATFVRGLLPYISLEPRKDREILRLGKSLTLVSSVDEFQKVPLRNYFVAQNDMAIVNVIWNYFASIKEHWPAAWESKDKGQIIKRTNGFRAFMNVFGEAFFAAGGSNKYQPNSSDFAPIWSSSNIKDEDFNSDLFVPGTSGETKLTSSLRSAIRVFQMK